MELIDKSKATLDELMNSRAWTYVLVGTSILTMFVALRNIYILSKQIAEKGGE